MLSVWNSTSSLYVLALVVQLLMSTSATRQFIPLYRSWQALWLVQIYYKTQIRLHVCVCLLPNFKPFQLKVFYLALLCLLHLSFFKTLQAHPHHKVIQPTRNHAKYIGLCVCAVC